MKTGCIAMLYRIVTTQHLDTDTHSVSGVSHIITHVRHKVAVFEGNKTCGYMGK